MTTSSVAPSRQPVPHPGLIVGDHSRGCVHNLFQAQARRTPDAVAVRFAAESLAYAELDARANRLAHLLRGRGVGPEVPVGICLPRTPEMIVSLLAVLKAGGAYLPLDPAYPRERLGFMLEDARARIVLTGSDLADRLPAGAEAVCLDRVADELAGLPSDAPASGTLPENLSHVIFTSGSTGRPKGVMVRHSSTVTLLNWLRDIVSAAERAAVLGSTSISFDVSVAEIFGTLCWGGTLHLVENALALAGMRDAGIVSAAMVPTAAAELLRAGGIPASVRTLNLAGEALPATLARGLYALGTVEKVGNLYGPTEDTSYSTYSLVPKGAERVTIGRPMTRTQARILDDELGLAPQGAEGELYLAGDGLARGYAGRPDLTAERFLPDPYGPAGSRMYRTTDRARWLPGAELEYLGRTDHQVKVRGFRIELGEIESVLLRHPQVHAAVAAVREDTPGDRRLAAYVVPAEEPGPTAAALRAHAGEHLPEFMVPGRIVLLPALPLTSSGKVDRNALPAPEGWRDEGTEYLAPRDELELALAGIWEEVLGVSPVGVDDDYFALGGHSLLAVRLMARIEAVVGARLPVTALAGARTVAALAALARRQASGVEASPLVPIHPSGNRTPLFFVHPVGGDVLCYAPLGRHLHPDQPFYALHARGMTGGEPRTTVEAMARDYVEAVRTVRPAGPYRLGGWSMGGVVAFEMARLLEAAGETVELLALVDATAPALLGEKLVDEERALVRGFASVMAHHLAGDRGLGGNPVLTRAMKAAEPRPREYLRGVLSALRGAGLAPSEVEFEQVWRMHGVFCANLRAVHAYRPQPYGGGAVLLRATARDAAEPETLGWEAVVRGGVEVRPVPGDHLGLLRESHAAGLAGALEEVLVRAAAP